MKKMFLLTTLLLSCALGFTGCGKDKEELSKEEEYIEQMEDGMFYVRSMGTNKITPVYFGNATFEKGKTSTQEQVSRVMWFKDDFEEIPTLYSGDSLIMRTDQEFDEHFIFERFEDVGYSVGLCHLEETDSGRYAISTDPKDCETYPGSDTDVILDNYKNSKVIIDTIGNIPIRKIDEETTSASFVSKFGTLLNLNKDQQYEVKVYEGTNENKHVFKADVHILGSMGGINSVEYYFDENEGQFNVINIKIPQEYNSGYYLINGLGMFRYVNGNSWGDSTNFNIPNPDDVTFSAKTVADAINMSNNPNSINNINNPYPNTDNTAQNNEMSDPAQEVVQTKSQKFSIEKPSIITISAVMDETNKVNTDEIPVGKVKGPSSQTWTLNLDEESLTYDKKFVAEETGQYIIEFTQLNGAEPVVTVSAKKLTDEQLKKLQEQNDDTKGIEDTTEESEVNDDEELD